MTERGDRLGELGAELSRRFGDAAQLERDEAVLNIRCANGASVGVSVEGDDGTGYVISYPCFDRDAASWHEREERVAHHVLLEGVVWIVREIIQHGSVLPEFPSARLRRIIRRR